MSENSSEVRDFPHTRGTDSSRSSDLKDLFCTAFKLPDVIVERVLSMKLREHD